MLKQMPQAFRFVGICRQTRKGRLKGGLQAGLPAPQQLLKHTRVFDFFTASGAVRVSKRFSDMLVDFGSGRLSNN